jgi:hypothetical protein
LTTVFDRVLNIEHTLHRGNLRRTSSEQLCWGDTMTITAATGITIINSRTFDHRTSSTHWGGPASRYQRVERQRAGGRVDRPDYAARRLGALIVALGSAVVVAALINSALAGLGGSPASAAEAAPASADPGIAEHIDGRGRHVARPGDSLWSIADQHRGAVNRDRYVDELIDLNGSTSIVVGQAVILP